MSEVKAKSFVGMEKNRQALEARKARIMAAIEKPRASVLSPVKRPKLKTANKTAADKNSSKTKIVAPKVPNLKTQERLDKKLKDLKMAPKDLYQRRLSPPNPTLHRLLTMPAHRGETPVIVDGNARSRQSIHNFNSVKDKPMHLV